MRKGNRRKHQLVFETDPPSAATERTQYVLNDRLDLTNQGALSAVRGQLAAEADDSWSIDRQTEAADEAGSAPTTSRADLPVAQDQHLGEIPTKNIAATLGEGLGSGPPAQGARGLRGSRVARTSSCRRSRENEGEGQAAARAHRKGPRLPSAHQERWRRQRRTTTAITPRRSAREGATPLARHKRLRPRTSANDRAVSHSNHPSFSSAEAHRPWPASLRRSWRCRRSSRRRPCRLTPPLLPAGKARI